MMRDTTDKTAQSAEQLQAQIAAAAAHTSIEKEKREELERSKEALRESEEKFRNLFNNPEIAMFRSRLDGSETLDVNQSFLDLIGKTREETIGRPSQILWADPVERDKMVRMLLAEGRVSRFEFRMLNARKGVRNCVTSLRLYREQGILEGTIADITERKRAETEMVRQNALLEAELNSTLDGILIVDPSGRKLLQNRRTAELWKIPQHIADNVDDSTQVRHIMHMTKNPEQFVEKVTYLYEHPNEASWDEVELKDGTVVERYSAPVRGKDGQNFGRIWTFHDITERKLQEKELKSRNTELERFIYTLSHDLRTPLVTLKTFLGYLEQGVIANDREQIAKDMGYMNSAADKMAVLLNELLEMTRIGRVVKEPVRFTFREWAHEAMESVAGRITENDVDVCVEENDIVLFGDRSRLSEILQNLIENSVKYRGDQKEPRIEIGAERMANDMIFYVRDNGIDRKSVV
jgi:PAS domain S-box-containing protein